MQVSPNVTLGAQVDWHHKSDRETQIVSTGPGPGGETIVTNRDLARSSSDLLPMMGYLQLNMGRLAISPYVGVAGGYEVLFLSAEDFATGEDFNGTFDGFGWQAWGGASISLSGPARLNAEVFINRGELDRDTHDPATGETFRESIDVDGAGIRGGVSFSF